MKYQENKIAVVIPAYRVKNKISQVLNSIQDFVSYVIVVDDCCPEESGTFIESQEYNSIQNLEVIFHEKNKGVGGAVVTGYKRALELGCDVVVKVDGVTRQSPSCATMSPVAGQADEATAFSFTIV